MPSRIIAVNQVQDRLIVTFDDEIAVFFSTEFLRYHRNDEGNEVLPAEKDGNKIG